MPQTIKRDSGLVLVRADSHGVRWTFFAIPVGLLEGTIQAKSVYDTWVVTDMPGAPPTILPPEFDSFEEAVTALEENIQKEVAARAAASPLDRQERELDRFFT